MEALVEEAACERGERFHILFQITMYSEASWLGRTAGARAVAAVSGGQPVPRGFRDVLISGRLFHAPS